MAVVVDASLAAAWFLPDEQNEAADRVMADLGANPGRAPSLVLVRNPQSIPHG